MFIGLFFVLLLLWAGGFLVFHVTAGLIALASTVRRHFPVFRICLPDGGVLFKGESHICEFE